MKNVIALSLLLVSAVAGATSPGLKLDSSTQFNGSGADCSANTLTVMRQFRAEQHPIAHDLCLTLKASADGWNIFGLTPDLTIRAIGYTEGGSEIIATSDQMK